MLVLIDNGHGKDTPGKRSPIWEDGTQLFEWEFNRDVAERLNYMLTIAGIESYILVPEKDDVPLYERVKRANEIYAKRNDAILISIHGNAGGGTGWEIFTTKGETESDILAEHLFRAAKMNLPEFSMRSDRRDGDSDKEEQFYILKKTHCPAVLTENLFMDNKHDCRFMMSRNGREIIAEAHYEGIVNYINSKTKGHD